MHRSHGLKRQSTLAWLAGRATRAAMQFGAPLHALLHAPTTKRINAKTPLGYNRAKHLKRMPAHNTMKPDSLDVDRWKLTPAAVRERKRANERGNRR